MTLAPAGYSEKKPATEEIQKIADQVNKKILQASFNVLNINLQNLFLYIIETVF